MEQNLEVFFCDLCNASVPQRDLETGDARRVNEKVVGRCCLVPLREGAPAAASSANPSGSGVVVGTVLLAAIAGATVFLDWRFGEEQARVGAALVGTRDDIGKQSERLARLERLSSEVAGRADLERVVQGLGALERARGAQEETNKNAIDAVVEGSTAQIAKLSLAFTDAVAMQRQQHETLHGELRALAADLAALKAAPRPEPRAEPAAPPAASPVEPAPAPNADSGLPPELAHQVARLGDADAAIRFEAVDKLVQSKNAAVLPPLLKMTKDVDDFVRRLTVEGLAGFRHPDTVDALLVALADPVNIVRMTAYNSLKVLTGQKLAFDPEGSQTDRLAAQRRWQEWWKTARKTF